MNRALLAATMLATGLYASAAFAQPPENALPLSEVLANLEAQGEVAYFDEVEWDSDGYWEIEYYRADGAKVEIRIDPVSGEPRR